MKISKFGEDRKSNFDVMYWRPKKISRKWLWFSLVVSVVGIALVQSFPVSVSHADLETMTGAAKKAEQAMRVIAEAQIARGHQALPKLDPQRSHLIGPSMSMVTSKMGSLESKQTSINPNFAAVIVGWLRDAGVQRGDRIAIGASGSWPSLNIATYSAAKSLGLKPTIVLSAASSQYGANSAEMMWVDMEQHLRDANVFSYRAAASTLGGLHDRACGMTAQTQAMLVSAIQRNGVKWMKTNSVEDSVQKRMSLYDERSDGDSYAAYINIGGGAASIGGTLGQECFSAGVHQKVCPTLETPDCVASRMLARGIPVIHVGNATSVAKQYAMSIAPTAMPTVGEGNAFGRQIYRNWLVILVMLVTSVVMMLTIAPASLIRGTQWLRRRTNNPILAPTSQVEWMV